MLADKQTNTVITILRSRIGGGVTIDISDKQVAAILTADGRIAAATYRIRLKISTARSIFLHTLYDGPGYVPPSNCPFSSEDPSSLLTHGFTGQLGSPHPKRHLDRFSRFGTARVYDQQTDTPTHADRQNSGSVQFA